MGTRSLTHIEERGKILVTIYRQYDGYPDGLGDDIKKLFAGYTIVNGYGGDTDKQANGMGCLAAQLIDGLKEGIGNVYIYPAGSSDCGEEYTYTLSNVGGKLHLKMQGYQEYDGLLDDFDPKHLKDAA